LSSDSGKHYPMKLAEVATDLEEKYDVYIGILTHPEAA
jgi:hypothetical protein